MKVIVYAYGTRGDVQPYMALAQALNAAGHDTVLCSPAQYESFAAEYGVSFAPCDGTYVDLMQSEEGKELTEQGALSGDKTERKRKLAEIKAKMEETHNRVIPRLLDQYSQAAADGADLIVHQAMGTDHSHHIAEKLGVPTVVGTLFPNVVTSGYYSSQLTKPSEQWPRTTLPRWLSKLSYVPARKMRVPGQIKKHVEQWRYQQLGLPKRSGQHDLLRRPDGGLVPVLNSFSREVIPPAPDWPDSVHTTGYWFLPPGQGWEPPAELVRFLDQGDPPVFFGFSSTVGTDPEHTGQMVAEAARRNGVRAVVVEGWGGIKITEPGDDVFVVDQVPYQWLFPRTKATVHAAGTGTMHAALAAGVPQVACAYHPEQMMFARPVRALGLSPDPLWQRELTTDALTEAVGKAVGDEAMAQRAREVGERVQAEDGLGNAVTVLERIKDAGLVRR